MSEQPFKWLDWRNRLTRYLIQPLDGVDCFQESVLLNPENNLIMLNLTEGQFLKMFSALMTGAEISYPDESLQLVADFLKGIQCPPTLIPEECFTLPTYANNIAYSPANPYIEPDEIPDGYLTQPFLVNGQNGNDFPDYEPFDVLVPFGAITFDIDFFDEIAGQLPTIQVVVQGTGSVNLKFLTSVQGGLVVVTLDNPPNLLDILAGIVTGAENIVDLNQDLVSLPPETAKELIYPVTIETSGIHTIYAVFLPILDDSLIPVRFGGGFRGIELCGFLPEGDMGLQNLRFVSCNLEQQNSDGSWSIVDGWEDWLDCVPSGGGGGGGSVLKVSNFFHTMSSTINTSNTTFTTTEVIFNLVPTYTKCLVIVHNMTLLNSGAAVVTEARIIRGGSIVGDDAQVTSVLGTNGRQVAVSDRFNGMTVGSSTSFAIQIRSVTAGTATINAATRINITVIEYEDESQLFVEDIRIVGRDLQKKIGGAWITVTDSLATILNSIEAIANNAAAAAAAAQSTANNALTVANGAVTVNNTQNTRLNNLESDVDDLQLSVAQHNLDIASLDSRMDAVESLQAVLAFGGVWAWYHDLTAAAGGYVLGSAGAGWTSGQGWISDSNGLQILYNPELLYQNQVTHIQCAVVYTGSPTGTSAWKVDGGDRASFRYAGVGNVSYGWYRLPNRANQQLTIEFEGSGNFKLIGLKYLGRGDDIPFD